MHIQHILESGHPISTTVGWIILIIAGIWVGPVLPYTYDAWIINRKINLATFDKKKSEQRQAAIERLTKYRNYVVTNTSWQNRSNVLNDFGRHTIIMSVSLIILMLIGVFFPAVLQALLWLITKTM